MALTQTACDGVSGATDVLEPFKHIMVSISGGADSDVVMDMVMRSVGSGSEVRFVYFDTGLEYQATKDHLDYLEDRYSVKIERMIPDKTIPVACREHGQPFLSKHVSEMIDRLQRHGFQWQDECYETLVGMYPGCMSALRWWCNMYNPTSKFNISRNRWLKEFLLMNPPAFRISNKCCHYAKKKVARDFKRDNGIDLSVTGMRKVEGGVRANAYKTSFTGDASGVSEYRPLWFFSNADRASYVDEFDIMHSDCYSVYGLQRTGCAGCPIGRNFEDELRVIREYEPSLYDTVLQVFGDSYDLTRKYRDFARIMNNSEMGVGWVREKIPCT